MLKLYSTISKTLEEFVPINKKDVCMYVCGPTVYDRPHLGNARSVVIYDLLYRVLRHEFGANSVTYVRNITDVDDKINTRAKERKITISELTQEVTKQFHEDMAALNVLPPTHEPRATEHIAEMVAIIEKLLARGHAYVAQNHVLFDVTSYKDYGQLSGRKLDDLISGARVAVEKYKKNPGDFVLWKPADTDDDPSSIFDSPFGKGRPGWHIECSAMSSKFLGDSFDIHGGGADLMFPHHENEIAQSRCADEFSQFAKTWVHNGFLTVNGEKMSKSVGNFITVFNLLEKGVKGEVIRLALLSSKYNEPLDWSEKLLSDCEKALDRFYRITDGVTASKTLPDEFISAIHDDLNMPKALSVMHSAEPANLLVIANFLGFLQMSAKTWFQQIKTGVPDAANIETQINARTEAKKAKNFAEADRIREALLAQGVLLEDTPGNITQWRYV